MFYLSPVLPLAYADNIRDPESALRPRACGAKPEGIISLVFVLNQNKTRQVETRREHHQGPLSVNIIREVLG